MADVGLTRVAVRREEPSNLRMVRPAAAGEKRLRNDSISRACERSEQGTRSCGSNLGASLIYLLGNLFTSNFD